MTLDPTKALNHVIDEYADPGGRPEPSTSSSKCPSSTWTDYGRPGTSPCSRCTSPRNLLVASSATNFTEKPP